MDANIELAMKNIKIEFIPVLTIPKEMHEAKVKASENRERIKSVAPHSRSLAVVGGGPSILGQIEMLRAWNGDIWAINMTCEWLSNLGIASTCYTVDSSLQEMKRPTLCTGALFASCVDPKIYDEFKDALCFDMVEDAEIGVQGGTSSACRTPVLAAMLGYTDVHFFGCEGSFQEGQTHAYRNETEHQNYLTVQAGENSYYTRDDLYMQCEYMAEVIRGLPWMLHNQSGGLLQGMIDHPDWEIVDVHGTLWEHVAKSMPLPTPYERRKQFQPNINGLA